MTGTLVDTFVDSLVQASAWALVAVVVYEMYGVLLVYLRYRERKRWLEGR